MATVSIFPALNAVVYDFDGDPILPIGIQVTWSEYYANLLRAGLILFDDPLEQLTAAAASETLTGSQITSTTMEDLRVRVGAFDGAIAHTSGYDGVYAGGGLVYRWKLGSAVADDGYYVLGAEASGRWHEQHRRAVSPIVFGADLSGVTDSTAALQAALDTGLDVEFPPGYYLASNLTQNTHNQRIFCVGGIARIQKNANGVIFTSTGNYVKLQNIEFRGESSTPSYTGHNATFSGNSVTLNHCGSYNAYALAIKATGNSCTIDGSCSIYNTTAGVDSAGDTNYDIELGVSGTSTLYHKLLNFNTTQRKGGIKLIDTGAAFIAGCEFGKLFFDAGSGAAGGGSGMVVGNRIHGTTVINQSNGRFTGNLWGQASKIEFGAGTSQIVLDSSNNIGAVTLVTNLGNANNRIEREVSAGSYNTLLIGDDTSTHEVQVDTAAGITWFPGHVRIPNNRGFQLTDTGGTYTGQLNMTTGNNMSVAHSYASGALQLVSTYGLVQLSGAQGISCLTPLTRVSTVAVAASGTQTQAAGVALAITADYINVATCAIANDAIALPAAAVGREVTVTNSGIATLQIFPYTSDDLGAGVNTSVTLAVGATAKWWAIDSTTWKRIV